MEGRGGGEAHGVADPKKMRICKYLVNLNVLNRKMRGRCYDENFRRFLPIFGGKKMTLLSKNKVMITFFQKLAVLGAKKPPILSPNFWAKIFLKSQHRSLNWLNS
jgi:hypothetical protein